MTAITGAGTTLFSTSSVFDKLDRLSTRTLTGGTYTQTTAYAYEWGTTLPQSVTVNGSTVSYTYDEAGSITTITDGSLVTYYIYDGLNQLVREDNAYSNKTVVYTYDNGGNILSRTEYPYSPTVEDVTTLTATNTVTYAYGNADWKDQLTSFNGEAITYDAIGNPLTYRGMTLTWQNGRQLATLSKAGLNVSYVYNDEGLRTQKTVNGVTTEYYWNGSQLLGQKTGDNYLYFLYDERGLLVGFNDGTKTYIYTRNLQGDVIAVTDAYTGTVVANYVYDSWGNVLTATGTMANINPFRYRGYYYDSETELYYLQSRYYDAEVGRFLNADGRMDRGIVSSNLYVYCDNNPIANIDPDGYCRVRFDGVVLSECNDITCPYRTSLPDLLLPKTFSKVFEASFKSIIAVIGKVEFDIGQYHIRIEGAHGSGPNVQKHIHIEDGKKEYSQNADGSPHDEGRTDGKPPKTLRKKLKKHPEHPWDWDGKQKEYEKKNNKSEFSFGDPVPAFSWNSEHAWDTDDESFWDLINPFKRR